MAFIRSQCDIAMDNQIKQGCLECIDQKAVDACLNECKSPDLLGGNSEKDDFLVKQNFVTEIRKSTTFNLTRIPCFFVNAYSLRNTVNGDANEVQYQEKQLIEFIKTQVKYSKNRIN